MRTPRLARQSLVRPRQHLLRVVELATLCCGLVSCLGGQTGTEAAPTLGSGGTKAGGQIDGSIPGTTTGNSAPNPLLPAACVPAGSAQGTLTDKAVTEFVQASSPFTVHYADGTTTSGTIVVVPAAEACQTSVGSAPSSLDVPSSILLTVDDDRLNFELDGLVVAHAAAEGGVADVELTGWRQCDRVNAPVAGGACQIEGLDLSAYPLVRLDLSVRIQAVAGSSQWLGTLRISASESSSCVTPPCSTNVWVTVAAMTLSN